MPQFALLVLRSTHVPLQLVAAHVQVPAMQSGVGCAQGAPEFCHSPVELQASGCAPLHDSGVVFGLHSPVQAPSTHA
jgi:hypothetical protein